MKKDFKYREIPYNYTSFSDKEIVLKYFDQETWDTLDYLRHHRVTGRSAKLLFDILGDIFIIDRNPYIFNDFLENPKKLKKLERLHAIRLNTIEMGTDKAEVKRLIQRARDVDRQFFNKFSTEERDRKKIRHAFRPILPEKDIEFSAFHKVTHVTDAIDWRVEYPKTVLYPSSIEQVIDIVKTAKKLGTPIIPRGGGTGLTGGAIPVNPNTIIVNTEKMRTIYPIQMETVGTIQIPVIETEAGAITESVMDYCQKNGYIFATDPTSAWASTIGGNISENSGGKKAVLWGTAIDNVLSFRIVDSHARMLEIARRDHPYRKIKPDDTVIFDVFDLRKKNDPQLIQTITLGGTDIRKKGIGKDITNKALGGLPGIQKEGGDGIIVSARFILYRPFQYVRTLCLEFYGKNLVNASKAIVGILNNYDQNGPVYLTALEHFDEKYVSAINYRNKSERQYLPKAVLLIDIESNDEDLLAKDCDAVISQVKGYDCDAFIASDKSTRTAFWKDRKNLGAIAKHTNAFKLNEDVVIPIEALPEFADFIEKLNCTKELENNSAIIEALIGYFETAMKSNDSFLLKKCLSFSEIIGAFKSFCDFLVKNLDSDSSVLKTITGHDSRGGKTVFELIRNGELTISIDGFISQFTEIFHGYGEVISDFLSLYETKRNKKIIIATHMHAGDGNIHVNIPVHSNDYLMLLEADETAGLVMEKTIKLGGVISGEHGIGLTKLPYIEQKILDDYAEYKNLADPENLFNPGKLRSDFPKRLVYTPSLNLLEMEAFILEAADLLDLTMSVSACVRCGKCKEVCNTHYPEGTMMFSPRNKILGVSLIIEAVLYESQTSTTLSFRNFKMLREISDHCTMCHNCAVPCPVTIDFGKVTLSVRKLLNERKRAKFKFVTWFTLFYLRRKGYYINTLFRLLLLKIGYSSQRLFYFINKPFSRITLKVLPKIGQMMLSRLPRSGKKSIREHLKLNASNSFYSFSHPDKPILKSVIYFPGCGSERLFPEISIATIAMLYYSGIRVVLPPEYLCCGYPLLANGREKTAETKSYENRVIFHRMAALLGYMEIHDLVVSCGTCFEMLQDYHIDNIFPDSSVIDINEFIARENLYASRQNDQILLYHGPCHSPLKFRGPDWVFNTILGKSQTDVAFCCGEGGTLALSTPHISNVIRERKISTILSANNGDEKNITVLTTCPSCVQGLSRIRGQINIQGESLICYLADTFLGDNWKKTFLKDLKRSKGFERIIF